MKSRFGIFAFLISSIAFLICAAVFEQQRTIICIVWIWTALLIYSLIDFSNRAFLFAFLVTFFVFLIAREALESFNLHPVLLRFSDDLNNFSENIIIISLLCIGFSYIIFSSINSRRKSFECSENHSVEKNTLQIRKASRLFFYLSYLFAIISVADIVLHVFQNGYLAYYTSYVRRVPYIFVKIGEMMIPSFWIFMATMPRKRECRKELVLYIVYLFATLGTGQRYPFVSGLLIVFVYFVIRNKDCDEAWMSKKLLLLIIILIPVMMAALSVFNQLRFGLSMTKISVFEAASEFTYQQGVSINVIKRTLMYHDSLPEGRLYTFNNLITLIKGNYISRLIGIPSFSGNTVENALYGNSLAHSLSYIVLKDAYLKGEGLGSCYIAEAFCDFGYLGVVLVNLFYGALLSILSKVKSKGTWKIAVSFVIFAPILLAPRGNADGFLGTLFDITTWGTFLIVYLFTKINYQFKFVFSRSRHLVHNN